MSLEPLVVAPFLTAACRDSSSHAPLSVCVAGAGPLGSAGQGWPHPPPTAAHTPGARGKGHSPSSSLNLFFHTINALYMHLSYTARLASEVSNVMVWLWVVSGGCGVWSRGAGLVACGNDRPPHPAPLTHTPTTSTTTHRQQQHQAIEGGQ